MTDYKLSRAIVEAVGTEEKTNKYFVRIIPYMNDIEKEALPTYPAFFANNFEAYDISNIVWCLHTEDYQVGYVLGLASKSSGNDVSLLLEKVHEAEDNFGLKRSEIPNLVFTIVDGVYLDFVDKKNNTVGRLTDMGTSIIYGGDGSISINAKSSSIELDSNGEIEIDSIDEKHDVKNSYSLEANSIEEKATDRKVTVNNNNVEKINGNNQKVTSGSNNEVVIGDSNELILSKKSTTIAKGDSKNILAGGDKIRVVVGDYNVTVIGGKINLTSGAGVNIVAGPAGVKITSAGAVAITSPKISLNTLSLNLNATSIVAPLGLAGPPSYVGPFCALPACLFTGAPHVSNRMAGVPAGT